MVFESWTSQYHNHNPTIQEGRIRKKKKKKKKGPRKRLDPALVYDDQAPHFHFPSASYPFTICMTEHSAQQIDQTFPNVFTDGSFKSYESRAGYGVFYVWKNRASGLAENVGVSSKFSYKISPREAPKQIDLANHKVSSMTMELLAILAALVHVQSFWTHHQLFLYTDCLEGLRLLLKFQQNAPCRLHVYEEFLRAIVEVAASSKIREIFLFKVRGHAKQDGLPEIFGNEAADKLAHMGAAGCCFRGAFSQLPSCTQGVGSSSVLDSLRDKSSETSYRFNVGNMDDHQKPPASSSSLPSDESAHTRSTPGLGNVADHSSSAAAKSVVSQAKTTSSKTVAAKIIKEVAENPRKSAMVVQGLWNEEASAANSLPSKAVVTSKSVETKVSQPAAAEVSSGSRRWIGEFFHRGLASGSIISKTSTVAGDRSADQNGSTSKTVLATRKDSDGSSKTIPEKKKSAAATGSSSSKIDCCKELARSSKNFVSEIPSTTTGHRDPVSETVIRTVTTSSSPTASFIQANPFSKEMTQVDKRSPFEKAIPSESVITISSDDEEAPADDSSVVTITDVQQQSPVGVSLDEAVQMTSSSQTLSAEEITMMSQACVEVEFGDEDLKQIIAGFSQEGDQYQIKTPAEISLEEETLSWEDFERIVDDVLAKFGYDDDDLDWIQRNWKEGAAALGLEFIPGSRDEEDRDEEDEVFEFDDGELLELVKTQWPQGAQALQL